MALPVHFFVLLGIVAGSSGAPFKFGGDVAFNTSSKTDWTAGGGVDIGLDGFKALTGKGYVDVGGNVKADAQGAGKANFGDTVIRAKDLQVGVDVGGHLKPSIDGSVGLRNSLHGNLETDHHLGGGIGGLITNEPDAPIIDKIDDGSQNQGSARRIQIYPDIPQQYYLPYRPAYPATRQVYSGYINGNGYPYGYGEVQGQGFGQGNQGQGGFGSGGFGQSGQGLDQFGPGVQGQGGFGQGQDGFGRPRGSFQGYGY